jgi:hypothetical protein
MSERTCTCKRIRYDEACHQLHDDGCPELSPDPTPSPTPEERT